MMQRILSIALLLLAVAAPLAAQTTGGAGLALTLDEVERRAMERNPQIAQARMATDAADYTVAEARTVFTPNMTVSFTQRSQTNPSTSQLAGGQTQVTNDALNYGTGISQRLPWGGASYTLDFNSNRSATSNVFSTFNPSYSSGVNFSFTQPLLRGFRFDAARGQIESADIARSVTDLQVRQQTAITLHAVRRAYWELVYAYDARDTAHRSEQLARQYLEDNRRRVELGTLAAIDIVEAEAEVATRRQASVQAEGAWRTAQVNLKQLIVTDASDPVWAATIMPVERPVMNAHSIDLPSALSTALATRTDLAIARRQLASTNVASKVANEERMPGVNLLVNYGLTGIGGTQILRGDSLGAAATGTIPGAYTDALRSLLGLDYPTWSVGLNVTMPLGKRAADAAYARAEVDKRQTLTRIEALQLQVAADVTKAADAIRTAEERVEAAVAARQLSERRLEAETARRDAGMSTTFLVLQAQRDLATAETSELRARLDLRTAHADFERAQTAP